MKIGIVIGRIGGVDGVALETEKWIHILHKMGHQIFILSGEYEDRKIEAEKETVLPILSFFAPETRWEQKHAFFHPEEEPEAVVEHIDTAAEFIAKKVERWIRKRELEILISENASALPSHLSMGVGIKRAVERTGIYTITHDHDFSWERDSRYVSPFKEINRLIDVTFPLRLPNSKHAVINTYGQETLKKKYGRDSAMVPNVMDFNKPFGVLKNQNKKLRKDLGLKKKDILLFQITRIVRRKGIEVAIELINKLQDKNIKLVITGNHYDDNKGEYNQELIDKIFELKLELQVIFGNRYISNHVGEAPEIKSQYSLSDAYANACACTYFSYYEGFGNAFVEAILAKTPIFVNNYKPVYWPDIGSKGFKTVMLEDNNLTDETVKEMDTIIRDKKLQKEIAEHNFELGKKLFSYDVLEEKLDELIRF